MSEKFVFTMRDLCKYYGDKCILNGINLSYFAGAKIGIVGENGAGKSTLLKIMAGVDREFEGFAEPAKGVRVGYVPQEPRLDPGLTVRENLMLAFKDTVAMLEKYDELAASMGQGGDDEKLMDEMSKVQERIDAVDGWELDRQVDMASAALLLPDDSAETARLSGGEMRRVFLARTLLEKPDILLLDEPTNHLDAETVYWLENHLREYPGTVIIVTHDRYFLDRITKWILELEGGKGYPFEGSYSDWLAMKAAQLEEAGKKAESHKKVLAKELEWIRTSPSGRRAKSRARVNRYEEMSAQNFDVQESSLEIQIPPGPHLGNFVLRTDRLNKAFGDNVLMQDFSVDIPPGAIVGIIGPNGAGKTTFFRMLTGEVEPDSGKLEIGPTVVLSYVDQSRESLNDEKTIYEEVSGGLDRIKLGDREIHSRAYVSRFNFKGTEQQKKVGKLSGGERNRVHLAKLLKSGGNVLLLDEPTNDLDTNTLRYLEEGLNNFPSSAFVISHDRFFLDRVCSHLLVFEGEGKVSWYEGGFEEYEAVLQQRKDNFIDRRAKYRKLHL